MRVIKPSRIRDYWKLHPKSKSPLEKWLAITRKATWKCFEDVRKIYRYADQVKTLSGKRVVIFDIGGNDYRLICACHYDRQKVFVLEFLTHGEYDKDHWKRNL